MNSVRACAVGLVLAAGLVVAPPASAANTPEEAANKKVVLDFYAALNAADDSHSMKESIPAIAEKYLSPQYTQHTLHLPGPGTDRDKLIRMFQNSPAGPPPGGKPMPRQRTDAVMAEGDRVMLLTSRDIPDPATGEAKPSYIFNMFRVKDGKLVEHWDVSPGMAGPPPGGPGGPAGGPPGGPPGAPSAPGAPPAR
jgi:predicted SnoaL-like aldol condensation-catalyzing enzyme